MGTPVLVGLLPVGMGTQWLKSTWIWVQVPVGIKPTGKDPDHPGTDL
jgi:hypothetical protein